MTYDDRKFKAYVESLDTIESRWQQEIPKEDGLYVGVWVDGSTFLVELAEERDGNRVAFDLCLEQVVGLEEVSCWLVPAVPLLPIPENDGYYPDL
jgi:hypothetical protein